MRTSSLARAITGCAGALLLSLFVSQAGCAAERHPEPGDEPIAAAAEGLASTDQSFLAPSPWGADFVTTKAWDDPKRIRTVGDADGDGRTDLIGFGQTGVYLSRSTGTSFEPAHLAVADFGTATGWTPDRHVRTVADVDGDHRDDIVGFGDGGVVISRSTGTNFAPPTLALANFGYNQGWRVDKHTRLVGNVDADIAHRADIVAFGDAGVYLSLGTATGFTQPVLTAANFGAKQGWTPARHIRTLADLNGDGRQDIVAFGDDGVWTALSTGSGFTAPAFVLASFGAAQAAGGWSTTRHDRRVLDIDGDGKADIVGFGENGVYTARGLGNGAFAAPVYSIADYGYAQSQSAARLVADFNKDGYKDIVVYDGGVDVRRSLGGPGLTFTPPKTVLNTSVPLGGLVLPGDVDHDGTTDLIVFGTYYENVIRSSTAPPFPPPAAPSKLRVTSATESFFYVVWDDNSNDEQDFMLDWGAGAALYPANTTGAGISGLSPNQQYCIEVRARSFAGVSSPSAVCARTTFAGPSIDLVTSTNSSLQVIIRQSGASSLSWELEGVPGSYGQESTNYATNTFTGLSAGQSYCVVAHSVKDGATSLASRSCFSTANLPTAGTLELTMHEDPPPPTGNVSYSTSWDIAGRTIEGLRAPGLSSGSGIVLLKPGHLPEDCTKPDAVVLLPQGGSLTKTQAASVHWSNGTTGQFIGCYFPAPGGNPLPGWLTLELDWSR